MSEIIQVVMPKVAILDALTVNYIDRDKAKSVMKVTIDLDDNIDDVAATVLEGVVQAHLLSAAGRFKQFATDRKTVVCSREIADSAAKWRYQRIVFVDQPLRTNEYPRVFNKHPWLEPSVYEPTGVVRNAIWEAAKFEMALFISRDGIKYDFIPLRVQNDGKADFIEISGDFDIDPDAVDAVVFKRHM